MYGDVVFSVWAWEAYNSLCLTCIQKATHSCHSCTKPPTAAQSHAHKLLVTNAAKSIQTLETGWKHESISWMQTSIASVVVRKLPNLHEKCCQDCSIPSVYFSGLDQKCHSSRHLPDVIFTKDQVFPQVIRREKEVTISLDAKEVTYSKFKVHRKLVPNLQSSKSILHNLRIYCHYPNTAYTKYN